ncbi:MAG: hypothetical protein N3B14_08530 [Thermoleophilia bacterium]|nr:hypothetical protein [Thermoleophilia bacterium]
MPKSGALVEEIEDAAGFVVHPWLRQLSAAMSDGASSSFLSSAWSSALVEGFRAQRWVWLLPRLLRPGLEKLLLKRARESFSRKQAAYVQRRLEEGGALKWYEEEGLAEGAHATFLGVVFFQRLGNRGGTYVAFATGDTCMFRVTGNRLALSFPLSSASQFSRYPSLLASCPKNGAGLAGPAIETLTARWEKDDLFILVTDALAQWFLAAVEKGRTPWDQICNVGCQADFEGFVAQLRAEEALADDDASLIYIKL